MKEAQYWKAIETKDKTVRCGLCPHRCVIAEGKNGICNARRNSGGSLVSLTYNQLTSVNLDPIEKKPLYHFHPGTKILSVGSFGCNFKCPFCQNWEISQSCRDDVSTTDYDPEKITEMARLGGSVGIAYTYNEPTVNFEWVRDTAKLAKTKGLVNVLVTNGYINPQPLAELMQCVDAANVDIKAFTDGFYRRLCGAKLSPVLDTVMAMDECGKHVEITNLLIPGENDSSQEIERLTDWLAGLNPHIPLHFSRYFPSFDYDAEATPIESLENAREIARGKLKYVYVGNVPDARYSKTLCPCCSAVLIEREGYDVKLRNFESGKCVKCGNKVKIIG